LIFVLLLFIFKLQQKNPMKRPTKPTLAILLALVLFGCSKNNSENSPATDQTPELHTYGVLPMQPEQWSYVPEFTKEIVSENARIPGAQVGVIKDISICLTLY
jgi:hypothetical protein